MPDPKLFMDTWQKLAKENGLNGIHFVGNIMGHVAEQRKEEVMSSGVDATVMSNLVYAETQCANSIGMYWKKFKTRKLGLGPERYDYKKVIRHMHTKYDQQENVYPCVIPQLDRTPRAGKEAVILYNSTPELFGKYVRETIDIVKDKDYEHRIIVINAWNEWGEGNYIEPDIKYGHGYLNALRNVVVE